MTRTQLSADFVRAIERRTKQSLIDTIELWAKQNGRTWIIGGPRKWSKQELVSAVIKIRQGQEL